MYPTTHELFHKWSEHHPESKLELVKGKLIVGNSLVGSRLMLRQILQGWRADAAIAFAPIDLWIDALTASFELPPLTQEGDGMTRLNALEAAVQEYAYQSEDLIAGQGISNTPYHPHHGVWQSLSAGLYGVAEVVGGRSLSRDFVMRLGITALRQMCCSTNPAD